MGDRGKVASIILIFFLFYFFFGFFNFWNYGTVNNTQDFVFHWGQIKRYGPGDSYWEQFDRETPDLDYPPVYHFLFSLFSFNKFSFYLANLFLIIVLIPILLFKVFRKWWAILIYFCGVSLPHQILYGATYPQALMLLYFLLYIVNRKNWELLLLLTILAYFTHSTGLLLFISIWGFELLGRFLNKNKVLLVGWMKPITLNSWREFIAIFFFQIPLPVFYFGLKKLKSGFFAGMIVLSFIAAIKDFRALSIAQLLFCILAGNALSDSSRKIKIGFALFLLFQRIFYLMDYAGGTWKFIA